MDTSQKIGIAVTALLALFTITIAIDRHWDEALVGLILAWGLYSTGGLIGGRYSLTKSIAQNYQTVKAAMPMPRLAVQLQSAAMVVAIGSSLYYLVGKRLVALVLGLAFSSMAIAGPPTHAYDVIGRTPAEIDSRFSVIIDQAMRDKANFHVHNLSTRCSANGTCVYNPEELGSLALLYRHSKGSTDSLLRLMAANVDAEGLTRVAAAFGQEATMAAVKKYAKPSVALEFASLPMKPLATPSILKTMPSLGKVLMSKGMYGGHMVRVQTPPNTTMTIYEIYLTYRSSAMGGLSVGSAITETGVFVAGDLMFANAVGQAAGAALNAWLNSSFPDVTPAIGDAIGNIVDHLSDAWATGIGVPGALEYGLNREIYQLADEGGSGMPWLSVGDYETYNDGAWYYYGMEVNSGCEGTDSCIQPY